MAKRNKIDKVKFAEGIVKLGMTEAQAFLHAGGSKGTGYAGNASRYADRDDVKVEVNKMLSKSVRKGLLRLPQLTETAVKRIGELIEDEDSRVALKASLAITKIAESIMLKGDAEEISKNSDNEKSAKELLSLLQDFKKEPKCIEGVVVDEDDSRK